MITDADLKLIRKDSNNKLQSSSSSSSTVATAKSSSNKSIRKSKLNTDFEVVPEDVVANINPQRKTRLPPSPLNLNLKQVI